MTNATEGRGASVLSAFLAGLQAGMIGAIWMLVWMSASAAWKRLNFWTPENLFATFFYNDVALRPGFSWHTISGLALYLVLYSLLGALFAASLRNRLPRLRAVLAGIMFGLCWYYLSFRWIFKAAMPLVALLHPERSTMIGHVIYGVLLGRFQAYIERPAEPAANPPMPEAPAEVPEP